MSEPYTSNPTAEAQKQQRKLRQLALYYQRIHPAVIADLHQKFGFNRWEADSEHLTDNQIARRVAMKGPLFHIEKMRKLVLKREPRRGKAKSATNDSPAEPSTPE